MTTRRNLNYLLTVLCTTLLIATGLLSYAYERSSDKALRQENLLLDLCAQIERSSENLTQLVRSYIATGDEHYKQAFQDIVTGHDSLTPAQKHNALAPDQTLISTGKLTSSAYGTPASLFAMTSQAGFTAEELANLQQAKVGSERLAGMDIAAMALLSSDATPQQRAQAEAMLYSRDYVHAKTEFLKSINEVQGMVLDHTRTVFDDAEDKRILWQNITLMMALLAAIFGFRLYRDIKRSDDSIRSEQAFSEAVFDTMGSVAVVLDRSGRIVRFNQAARASTGFGFEELKGQPIWDYLIPPEAQPAVRAIFEELKHDKIAKHVENEWLTKEGGRRLFAWHNAVLHDSKGTVTYAVAIGEDITERRRMEAELQRYQQDLEQLVKDRVAELGETTQQLELAISAAQLGKWSWHIPDNKSIWDTRTLELFAVPEAQRDKPVDYGLWRSRVHPDDIAAVEQRLKDYLQGVSDTYAAEYRLLLPGGEVRHIETNAFLERNANGDPIRLIGINRDITDRVKRDRALNTAHAQLQATQFAMDSVGIGVIWMDIANARFIYVNSAAAAMLGYSQEEMPRLTVPDIDPDMTLDTFAETAERIRREGQAHFEALYRRKNGSRVPTEVTVYYQKAQGDLPEHFVAFITDISERKQLENTLRDKTNELDTILENASVGIALVSNRIVIRGNRRMAELFGYTPEEIAGAGIDMFYPDQEKLEALKRDIDSILDDGRQAIRELQLRHHDGHLFWARITGNAIDHTQANAGSIWVFEDINDRKEAEQALKSREAFYRTLFEKAPQAYQSLDYQGRIIDVNETWLKMFGCPHKTAVIGRSFGDFIADASKPQLAVAFERFKREGFAASPILTALRADNGKAFSITVHGRLDRDSAGNFLRSHCLLTDVSERVRAEQNLVAAKEAAEATTMAKSQFVANMSHEIRTPLNAVIGLLQLMGSTSMTQQQSGYVQKAYDSANTLLSLLNDILDFSKIEAGMMELEIVPFELNELINRISSILAKSAEGKGLALRVMIAPGCPDSLFGDVTRLTQVLLNLGSNAIKFTDAGSVDILVSIETPGRRKVLAPTVAARFEVRDTGIGIAPDRLDKIFERFTQVDNGKTRRFGGTGLGLAISRSLVRLMGGEIHVESIPREGSRFWFVLPLERLDSVAAPATRLHASGAIPVLQPNALAGLHILAVDDNPLGQDVIADLLEKMGATVELAANGYEAIDRILNSTSTYDLVLMDIQMPMMDGIEATRLLRSIYGVVDLPIIAMTADAQPSDRQACLKVGMNDFLAKPFSIDDLRSLIEKHCHHSLATGATTAAVDTDLSASVADPPGFDLTGAIGRLGGQTTIFSSLSRRFLGSIGPTMASLRTMINEASAEADAQAGRALHTLRGSALTLGAMELAETAKDIESALTDSESPDRAALSAKLDDVVKRSVATLGKIVDRIDAETDKQSHVPTP